MKDFRSKKVGGKNTTEKVEDAGVSTKKKSTKKKTTKNSSASKK